MLARVYLVFLIFYGPYCYGQIDIQRVHESPYAAIYNHLYYLQDDSYEPLRAALSLPQGATERDAIKLKEILDGRGIFVDLNILPTDPNYKDTLTNTSVYYLDNRSLQIFLVQIDGQWRYARETVSAIPTLHKETFPLGLNWISIPQDSIWKSRFLNTELWQWLGVGILLLISYSVFLITKKIIYQIISKILRKKINNRGELKIVSQKNSSRLIGIYLAVRVMHILIPYLKLHPYLNELAIKGLYLLSIFLLIFLINSVLKLVFLQLETLAEKTENTLDDQLLPVLRKLLSIIVWAIGIIFILDHLGTNVTALLAGMSIGGLALALAAQDTVKNFFGSIMIFLDKPFQIGDWINFNGVDGVVEEVGVRSTRVRTFANSLTYVPNGLIADTIVNNYGLRQFRRFKTDIGITYDTPPDAIDAFIEGIKRIIQIHPLARHDSFEVHLNSFGSSSLNILLYMFFSVDSWTEELRGRHEVMMSIIQLAQDLGIRFAFPTQTLHIEEMAGLDSHRTPQPQSPKEINHNMEKSLRRIETYIGKERPDHQNKKLLGGE